MGRARMGGLAGASPWLLGLGVVVDQLSDGIMIGTGVGYSLGLGLLLGLAQLPANVPGGVALMATAKESGMKRGRWRLMLGAMALPVLGGRRWLLRSSEVSRC